MRRTFLGKLALLASAVVAALLLTVYRPSPKGLMPFGVGQAEVRAAPGLPAAQANPAYNLSQLRIVNLTLQKVHDNYVDPTRIDAKAMLLSALDSVQRNVAEVLAEPADDKKSVKVQVNDKQETFAIDDVDSPWRLHGRMRDIFRFIQANMNPASDPAQIEYAAANGILSTLDPHSVLLDPEQAREMDISTSGRFGGIGIVIGMRKGKLRVLKLISQETPAAKAGLQAGDHIVKINNDVTANLTLNEAMNRLRGDPRTRVVVTVERRGVAGTQEVPITRALIMVSSVESQLLKGNVGYFKINSFAQETTRDLSRAMDDLKARGARSFVMDLRGNPGGLLDQAIRVTDLFVNTGTIVTTVGYAGKQREEKRARQDERDSQAPLVVLVNGASASASEIVAGALKNLNRAVVIGQTSFGKGSVQVLFDNEDGSKLKLTIAQYLTPGDVSIQSIGITPDVELVRTRVPDQVKGYRDAVRLLGKSHFTREADLDAHLTSKNARQGDRPTETLKYLYLPPPSATPPPDDDDDDDTATVEEDEELEELGQDDKFVEDFEIQFARDYVAQATSVKRSDVLGGSRGFVQKRRAEEESKIGGALAKLGVDWAVGAKTGAPHLAAAVAFDKPLGKVVAGDVVAVTGTVTNSGTGPAYRVHAVMKSDDYTFDDTELVFGRVDAGVAKPFTAYVKVPLAATTRMDELHLDFTEANGVPVDAQPLRVAVEGQPRPTFAYTYQLIDDGGNGDGLVQAGESHRLHVTVRNMGAGRSRRATATLRNASGDGVTVNKGRFELGSIPPGETRTVDFTFDVGKDFAGKELVTELTVYDSSLLESVGEKLKIPMRPAAAGPTPQAGQARVVKKEGVAVHEGAADDAAVVGNARRGTVFKVTGREGGWTRVEVEANRPGFVATTALQATSGAETEGAFVPTWQVTPPTIAVSAPSLEATGERWKLSGSAQDDNHLEDVFVLVSNRDAKIEGRKVLYRSNRGGHSQSRLDFSGDIPIWPGNNMVTVVARENNEVRSTQTLFVYRTDGQRHAHQDGEAAKSR